MVRALCSILYNYFSYLDGEIDIIDKGPCTVNAFICKVGAYPAIQRTSLVFTIVWKFHESSWKSAFEEKAKAKVSRTSESAK